MKDDIVFAPDEPFCATKQAQITHFYNDYYLREMSLNGHTRIKIKKGIRLKLEKHWTISFGPANKIVVLNVEEEEPPKDIEPE